MLLLRGGRVVCPLSGRDERADVLLEGGEIAAVGLGLDAGRAEVLDCAGAAILPGFVDLAADFADPGATWREDLASGAAAAAAGGFTTVVLSPATDPVVDTPAVAADLARRAREQAVRIEVAGALTTGLQGAELAEMGLLVEAGCAALSDGGRATGRPRALRRALEYARPHGAPVLLRPGEPSLEERGLMHEGLVSARIGLRGLPAEAEEIGVATILALARLTGARVHLAPVTTARALALVAAAQGEGLPVSAAVPARNLVLTDEAVEADGYRSDLRLLPPLRPEEDRRALIAALPNRLCVTADHVPWSLAEKELEFGYAQPGSIGLETAAAAAFTALEGDLAALAAALSTRPAAVLGRQPRIAPGEAADLAIFDPGARWSPRPPWRSRGCNEALLGRPLRGRVRYTVVGGRLVYGDPGS